MADNTQQLEILSSGLGLTEEQLALLTSNLETLKTAQLSELSEAVARAKEGTRLTRRGFDLLGKALAGKQLHFTRVALGDANGLMPTEEEQYEMTDMINPRFEANISDMRFTGGGTATVTCLVQNANVQNGFRIAEVGLFALDPDTNEEILYCYRNSGVASSYMPGGGGAVFWNLTLSIVTVVDNATNVTAVIDASLLYVSQADFLQHVNSDNPHPNLPSVAEPVIAADTIWVNLGDNKLHPMSFENLQRLVLNGDASAIPKINSRLVETEINLANLYMQLNAEKDLGLQPNLMMVEDFIDKKNCDLYICGVVTAGAGVNTIQLESDQGILAGCWYTISDGTRSEYVQVHSIIRNGDKFMVVLEQYLDNTYDLTRTFLLRSTANVLTGQAEGAGDIRSQQFTMDEVWRGSGSNVENALILDTTQKNSTSFEVTGDGGYTTDGFFTLTA